MGVFIYDFMTSLVINLDLFARSYYEGTHLFNNWGKTVSVAEKNKFKKKNLILS